MELGRFDDAEPLVRDTLLRRQKVLSTDHPDTLVSLTNLGLFLRRKGDLVAAEPLMREAVERSRHVKGDDHPDTLVAMSNLGSLLLAQDRLEDAGPYFVEAWEVAQRVLRDDHPLKARTIYELGVYRFRQKKLKEAEPLLMDALDRRRALFGDDHLDTLYVMDNLGTLRREQGLLDQAEGLFRDVLAGYKRALNDPDHWQIGDAHADLGIVLTMLNRHAEAEAELIEAERILAAASEHHARRLGRCLESLITLYRAWDMAKPGLGYVEKAQAWQAKFDDLFLPVPPSDVNAAD